MMCCNGWHVEAHVLIHASMSWLKEESRVMMLCAQHHPALDQLAAALHVDSNGKRGANTLDCLKSYAPA